MKVRRPNNAGSWYAGSEATLRRQIERECFLSPLGPGALPKAEKARSQRVFGLLCPHAGYIYSGPVAAHSYYILAGEPQPRHVVVLGPNHTGMGSGVSVAVEGLWRTPLGDVEIDTELARAIQKGSSYIDIDDTAHQYEHSIELQLPFLQYILGPSFKLTPVCMMLQEPEVALDVGRAVAGAVKGKETVIIASSDMTHYEPQEVAKRKDETAIEAMEKLDEAALYRRVEELNISMCGLGPVAATIVATKALGAERGELLKYATSGDTSGDRSAVVGYCALAFTKG